MALSEQATPRGRVTLVLRDSAGRVVQRRHVRNLITRTGRRWLAGVFAGTESPAVLYMALGTSDSEASIDDAALGDPALETEATLVGPDIADITDTMVTITANFPGEDVGEVVALAEAGVWIGPPDDPERILYNRTTFPVVNLGSSLSLTLTWEISF